MLFAIVLLTSAPLSLGACGDSAGSQPADPAPPAGDGAPNASVDPDGGPADGAVDAVDGAPPDDAPATPLGKLDELCAFTNDVFYRGNGVLLVDPTGKRIAYPRLAAGDIGEIVIRDLATNKVTKIGSVGACTYQQEVVKEWSAMAEVSWMRSTPYGILFADVDSALHLVDWTGAEKARLPPASHAWKNGEVTAVSAAPNGIRAALVRRTGAASHLVTFTSDAGAGTFVESEELSPALAANADISTAVSADGSHAAAMVGYNMLYAAPTTAAATAQVKRFTNATIRSERTARGALVRDFDFIGGSLRHVDFATLLTEDLASFSGEVVSTSQLGPALYSSTILSSGSPDTAVVTRLSTWRFEPGATPTLLAQTVPVEGNPPKFGTYVARFTPDASNYVFSLDGRDSRKGLDLVYSIALGPASSAFRPVRVASGWALGGAAVLVTDEGAKMRFENLAPGAGPAIEVPLPADHGELEAVSKNGRVAFLENYVHDNVNKTVLYKLESISDTGVHRDLTAWLPNPWSSDFQAAWSDGLAAVRDDGIYFFR